MKCKYCENKMPRDGKMTSNQWSRMSIASRKNYVRRLTKVINTSFTEVKRPNIFQRIFGKKRG